MQAFKSILLSVLKSVVTERLFKAILFYALDKYAEANDNKLTHEAVKGVKDALNEREEEKKDGENKD